MHEKPKIPINTLDIQRIRFKEFGMDSIEVNTEYFNMLCNKFLVVIKPATHISEGTFDRVLITHIPMKYI